jgi:tRNA1(Val) A37 N6-methylase TrmN6
MHLDYKQPNFYKFSEDSIVLSQFASKFIATKRRVLDLCAGSGVVGIEIAHASKQTFSLDFVEVQQEFIPYLYENLSLISDFPTRVFESSIGNFKPDTNYDLIVCNPPYFLKGEGRESPNWNKQVSRTFEIDNISILLNCAINLLSRSGVFIFCYPSHERAWEAAIAHQNLSKEIIEVSDHLRLCVLSQSDADK